MANTVISVQEDGTPIFGEVPEASASQRRQSFIDDLIVPGQGYDDAYFRNLWDTTNGGIDTKLAAIAAVGLGNAGAIQWAQEAGVASPQELASSGTGIAVQQAKAESDSRSGNFVLPGGFDTGMPWWAPIAAGVGGFAASGAAGVGAAGADAAGAAGAAGGAAGTAGGGLTLAETAGVTAGAGAGTGATGLAALGPSEIGMEGAALWSPSEIGFEAAAAGAGGSGAGGTALSGLAEGGATGSAAAGAGSIFGSAAPYAQVLAAGLPALLGAYASKKQSDSLGGLADKYLEIGAPSRGRFEASFDPNFSMANEPGYKDALDQTTKSFLHKASITGNPADSPNAWMQTLKDVNSNFAFPALNEYRRVNAGAGGLAALTSAAPGADLASVNAQRGIYDSIGAGTADIFSPRRSLEDVLAAYRRAGY